MPDRPGRLRAVPSALIAAVLLVGFAGPASSLAVDPPNLDRFMASLAAVESNGRYDAVNATSGALGRYQILPSNWRAWARRYLGDPDAPPTPENQEQVARQKLIALYGWLDDWGAVAHWWLTGDGETDPTRWSGFSSRYVSRVLAGMDAPIRRGARPASGTPAAPSTKGRAVDDSDTLIDFSEGWDEAEFPRYNGGQVRYAVEPGATAELTFGGRSIAWVGPVGPTRGEARIYLDGELVSTVDAHATRFRPRADLFSAAFDRFGTHTITIEVAGTPGRETIAIDEFLIGR
ncbi:MAG TPA: transglycosylase family protein [Candidatus Sulfomarinibacteraceae bacterium]|nr:transglycosylase family protein [Candidatus Sulfomarinibacteraceae bacterium]